MTKIIVVDDEEQILQYYTEELSNDGYEVVSELRAKIKKAVDLQLHAYFSVDKEDFMQITSNTSDLRKA